MDKEPAEEKKLKQVLESAGFDPILEPRNIGEVDQLFEKLTYYFRDIDSSLVKDEYIEYGFKVAFKKFARPRQMVEDGKYLSPLKDKEEVVKAVKQDKASGAPFFTQKGFVFDYVWDRLYNKVLPEKMALQPAAAYYRTTEEGKTRLVWAMSLEAIIIESRFARPLIQYFLENDSPMTIGYWSINLGSKISSYMTKRYVYTLDYSKYDMTIPRTFILEAFKILSTWFSDEDKELLDWKLMVYNFIYTPIVMPDGNVYYGKNHGVPSGSYFTQLIDSIINVAIIMAISKKFGLHVNADNVFVLGDDSIFTSYTWLDTKLLSKWVKERYGIIIHPEKSELIDTHMCRVFHYLGKYWHLGVPHRPESEVLSRIISPERRQRLSWKTVEQAEASNALLLTRLLAYCADSNEGMLLLSRLCLDPFRPISMMRLQNIKKNLPGLTRFKIESMELERKTKMQRFCSGGVVGMYLK